MISVIQRLSSLRSRSPDGVAQLWIVSQQMLSPFPIIIAVGILVVGCSPSGKGPLSVPSPSDWKVEHKDTYNVTAKAPDECFLTFSQWPRSRPEDIPAQLQGVADGFLEHIKKSPEFADTSKDYQIEHFVGEHCQGSYVVFQSTGSGRSAVQVVFMMSVDGKVWGGQFSGTSNVWEQALAVLKSIKKNG